MSVFLTPCSSSPVRIFADLGGNATLPCRLLSKRPSAGVRIKWTKLENAGAPAEEVLLSLGTRTRTFGRYENRVFLREGDGRDASLVITDIAVEDMGQYRCEVINGTKHTVEDGFLKVQGCLIEGETRSLNVPSFLPLMPARSSRAQVSSSRTRRRRAATT